MGNCDNCSAVCDKVSYHADFTASNHEGKQRWFYKCQSFTGDWKKRHNDISIVWHVNSWTVKVGTSIKEWSDDVWSGTPTDAQISHKDSVCIDPEGTSIDTPGREQNGPQTALLYGSLECLNWEPDWVF